MFPRPLALLLLPFGLGIAAVHAGYPELSGWFLCIIGAFGSVLLLFGARSTDASRRISGVRGFSPWIGAAMVLFAMGYWHLGFTCRSLEDRSQDLLSLANRPGKHVITGQVIRAPLPANDGVRLLVAASESHTPSGDLSISGIMSLTVQGILAQDCSPGDWIRFAASLRPVRNFKTPGAFDQETWWAIRGVKVKGFVNHPLRFSQVGHSRGSSDMSLLRYWLESGRRAIMLGIDRCLDGPARGIAMALLLGERAWLSKDLKEAFARAGIGHLLAVSGIHMALAALLIGGLARALLLRSEWITLRFPVKKLAISLALIGAVTYAGLAGFSPSAVRAMVMILAFGVAFLIDRPQTSLNSLALAAWALLIFNPMYLFGISFQLSFTAVFFLIMFSSYLRSVPKEKKRNGQKHFWIYIRGFILVTLIATLATAPFVAWHFQRVCLVGLLTNLLVVPVTSFVILPGLLLGVILLPLFPELTSGLWQGVGWLLDYLVDFIHFVSGWNLSAVWVLRPSILQVSLFYLVLGSLALMRHWKISRALAILFFALLLSASAYREWNLSHQDSLRLHVIDIGQGTSQVVELPKGKLMVMDGGGLRSPYFDIGERVVAPFIRHLGYRKIDIIVLSHPEQDHMGGLAALVRQFPVGELWTNDDISKGLSWRRLIEACAQRGVRHRVWQEGRTDHIGDVMLEIWPSTGCEGARGRNGRSLVLELDYGKHSILLTGDIGRAREQCLLKEGIGPVDVLVVPHHGSKTSSSSEFVGQIHPEIAIVPVGWRNSLGLPDPQVLERYKKAGSNLLRIDLDGTVCVEIDGDVLSVDKYKAHNL
ncbi:MAG: DNA internalization-related competence protein ComEC/Rec2 [Deltaproteobacteria bacterium]|nr:DNA internalization-related competence protein ComEC/Rec2 [Deltaproteobacteria bacterium]MDL1961997.1 DNA internalization-related competence protein ComEC/Rec2 [Deltaproteobacteria bacterium]